MDSNNTESFFAWTPRPSVLSSAKQYTMYLGSVPVVDDEEVNLDLTCWGIDANPCFEFCSDNSALGIAPAIKPSESAFAPKH
eukprot:202385-Ditylum_brightwellii.AAC.1